MTAPGTGRGDEGLVNGQDITGNLIPLTYGLSTGVDGPEPSCR